MISIDMKIPECCGECPFIEHSDVRCGGGGTIYLGECSVNKYRGRASVMYDMDAIAIDGKRWENCPLMEIQTYDPNEMKDIDIKNWDALHTGGYNG